MLSCGQRFTWFLLQASGGSHLLEISRSRWPQAPRGDATLSQRQSLWQMSVLLHPLTHKSPSIEVRREKSPSEASLLLSSLAPVAHSLCLMLSWEMLTGCQGIRGAESLMSRLLARLAAFDASFGCVTAPSTLSGSWRHNAWGEKWLHSNSCTGKHYISLCYIICNSILHYVKVNCQMYHLKQRFSPLSRRPPIYTKQSKTIQDSEFACFSIKTIAIEREKRPGPHL